MKRILVLVAIAASAAAAFVPAPVDARGGGPGASPGSRGPGASPGNRGPGAGPGHRGPGHGRPGHGGHGHWRGGHGGYNRYWYGHYWGGYGYGFGAYDWWAPVHTVIVAPAYGTIVYDAPLMAGPVYGVEPVGVGQMVPQTVPAPEPIFYPRNGQSAETTESDRRECDRWAATQRGAATDATIFWRATLACMEGRGYTAR